MISLPPAKMSPAQLEARIRIHESTAEYFKLKDESGMAREFMELARKYRTELNGRRDQTVPQTETALPGRPSARPLPAAGCRLCTRRTAASG